MPHAIMFPYPTQGHINPMTQLSLRLVENGFFITFIHTEYNHARLLNNGSSNDVMSTPNLRFVAIPDGLPAEHARINQNVVEFMEAIEMLQAPLESLIKNIVSDTPHPVTCIVGDVVCGWVQDIADAVKLPRVVLWTTPVHANLAYCAQSLLMKEGIIPFTGNERGSKLVTCIPGILPFRASELISFFQTEEASTDFLFQWCLTHFSDRPREAAWNLGNNIYELERPAIDAFGQQVQQFLPIGPLLPHAYFTDETIFTSGTSLWPEEIDCKEWLDKQKPGSVLYISFGSIVKMSFKQVEELEEGLEACGQPYLWVLRSDYIGVDRRAKSGRGLLVSWAPQLLVLKHKSVGAFMTHCGWNSIMEGMCGGVPILAWPGGFAEQKMNVRYVVEEWGVGMTFQQEDVEGQREDEKVILRKGIETAIKALMIGTQGESIKSKASHMQALASSAISPGGSSHKNLNFFVEQMILLSQHKPCPP